MYAAGACHSGGHDLGSYWLPLVDALRTRLLGSAPDVVETMDRFRFSAELVAGAGTVC